MMTVSLIKWLEDGPCQSSKYDSLRDEYLHVIGPDYWDEWSGDSEAPTGWFALVINTPESATALAEAGEIYGLSPVKGIIGNFVLAGDDRGFCYVSEFETEELARSAYAMGELAYSEWLDSDEEV